MNVIFEMAAQEVTVPMDGEARIYSHGERQTGGDWAKRHPPWEATISYI